MDSSITFVIHNCREFSFTNSPNIKIIDLGLFTIYIVKKNKSVEKFLNEIYYKDNVEGIYENITK